ncbi:hypothetical protein ACH4FA_34695 [Streptomyces sp. NPDC017966]|uniref:hypothetical protein n=1 Tax=Streptomyces sp. NPDC017966 TaxID=3365023 RepID=UPI00378B3FC9
MGHELDFGMPGPLVVRRAGAVLDPGRRKQRQLLIRLLLADGHAVAGETLCDELWPPQRGRSQGGATASLYAHVSKIRATLEPRCRQSAFEVLVTEPAGYALRVPPQSRDNDSLVGRQTGKAAESVPASTRQGPRTGRAPAAGGGAHAFRAPVFSRRTRFPHQPEFRPASPCRRVQRPGWMPPVSPARSRPPPLSASVRP